MNSQGVALDLVVAAWNVTKTELIVTTLLLAAALLLAALILKLVSRWQKRQGDDAESPEDQLAYFQELHWKGELSKEEFERIEARLSGQTRQVQATPNPAAPPASSEGTQPPAQPG